MSSTTLSKSVLKILASTYSIDRVDALPELIRRYPVLDGKLQPTADGSLVSVLVHRDSCKTLVVLHTNQACYGCVPFRMDQIIEENFRNRASMVAVLVTLLSGNPPGLNGAGEFDLGRACPTLMQGKNPAITNASSFGGKGGVWRKITDKHHEVTAENKGGWIGFVALRILDEAILSARDRKDASIYVGNMIENGEEAPTSVVYKDDERKAVAESSKRLARAAEMLAGGDEENVYGDNLELLRGDIQTLGEARLEAGRCKKMAKFLKAVEDAGGFAELVALAEATSEGQRTGAMRQALGKSEGLKTAGDNLDKAIKAAGGFAELVALAEATSEGQRTGAMRQALGKSEGLKIGREAAHAASIKAKATNWLHVCCVCRSDDDSETCMLGRLEAAGRRGNHDTHFDSALELPCHREYRSGDTVKAHEKCRRCCECEFVFTPRRKAKNAKTYSVNYLRYICERCYSSSNSEEEGSSSSSSSED